MKKIMILSCFIFIHSCASNKEVATPSFYEVKTKKISKDEIIIESLQRDDIACFGKDDRTVIYEKCRGLGNSMLFMHSKDAVEYSQEIAKDMCDGEATPTSAVVSKEVVGKNPSYCKGEALIYYTSFALTNQSCTGGDDKFYKKVTMTYSCVKN